MFGVDDYENYVKVQSESAVRALASSYPYDAHTTGEAALSSHTAEVAANLMQQLSDRLAKAGVEVRGARISHLAYAPEIAQAMLQRQQASAIVAARYKIVEGAVGMVENALEMLAQKNILRLDDERKAAMVSNLLVVLCGERGTQPGRPAHGRAKVHPPPPRSGAARSAAAVGRGGAPLAQCPDRVPAPARGPRGG